jgi:hypothetical protein
MTIALERPGASSDQGTYGDLIDGQNVVGRLSLPDLSAEYRKATGFGYVELAGIARSIQWEDQVADSIDLDGSALGWGLNLSTNINAGKNTVIRGQFVYGQGIQNYLNDASADIGVKANQGNTTKPIEGYALPVFGALLFVDHSWSEKVTSTIGYSMLDMQLASTSDSSNFKTGGYALANVLFHPVPKMLWGVEVQYGSRQNFKDGWDYNAVKVQMSFKYNFGTTIYRKKSA